MPCLSPLTASEKMRAHTPCQCSHTGLQLPARTINVTSAFPSKRTKTDPARTKNAHQLRRLFGWLAGLGARPLRCLDCTKVGGERASAPDPNFRDSERYAGLPGGSLLSRLWRNRCESKPSSIGARRGRRQKKVKKKFLTYETAWLPYRQFDKLWINSRKTLFLKDKCRRYLCEGCRFGSRRA